MDSSESFCQSGMWNVFIPNRRAGLSFLHAHTDLGIFKIDLYFLRIESSLIQLNTKLLVIDAHPYGKGHCDRSQM